jgi:hypothetical protein
MALSIQKDKQDAPSLQKHRLLGMILCDLNLITPTDNYYVLHKYNRIRSIHSLLKSRQILSREDIIKAENRSRELDIPFISCLLETGQVSSVAMQKILFDLFHVPFRSISDFIFKEKLRKQLVRVIDKDQSWKQKIIPLVLKDNTILFGITDPENLLFIKQLNEKFPQYRFKNLFIPFSGFSWFYKIIYDIPKKLDPSGPYEHDEKQLDLSLLLTFKATINKENMKDHDQKNESIRILYNRYELLRHLMGNPKRDNLLGEFTEFIQRTYKEISREYQTQNIEFFLKKEDRNVNIVAFPNPGKLDK